MMMSLKKPMGRAMGMAVVWLALAGAGCRSTNPEMPTSDSLVAVVIQGATPEAIRQAALEVFKEDGFATAYAGPTRLVFERPGTAMDNAAYGGWMEGDIWLRVKVDIKPIWPSGQGVEMDAFKVSDHNDSWFEDERKVRYKKGPYKKLMKRIQERVAKPAP